MFFPAVLITSWVCACSPCGVATTWAPSWPLTVVLRSVLHLADWPKQPFWSLHSPWPPPGLYVNKCIFADSVCHMHVVWAARLLTGLKDLACTYEICNWVER